MIPNDKIVVVTGDPRSGTSLMMQILVALGVPVAGEKFPQTPTIWRRLWRAVRGLRNPRAEAVRRAKQLNPRGFYELPGVVMRGLPDARRHGGKAVKIMFPAARPRIVGGTPAEIVYRYIVCLRHPREIAESQSHLMRPLQVAGAVAWDQPSLRPTPFRYVAEVGQFADWLIEADPAAEWIAIDYADLLADPGASIRRIIDHLGVSATLVQREAAYRSIDPSLHRSRLADWPRGTADAGDVAESYYRALKGQALPLIAAAHAQAQEYLDRRRRETVHWYDPSLGVFLTPSLARRLPPLTRKVLLREFKKELRAGRHPMVDQTFSLAPETYTIERPADLGDLARQKVRYAGETLTWEDARRLHRVRLHSGHVRIDSRKLTSKLREIGR